MLWSFPWRRESNGCHEFRIRYLTSHKISGIRREMTYLPYQSTLELTLIYFLLQQVAKFFFELSDLGSYHY